MTDDNRDVPDAIDEAWREPGSICQSPSRNFQMTIPLKGWENG